LKKESKLTSGSSWAVRNDTFRNPSTQYESIVARTSTYRECRRIYGQEKRDESVLGGVKSGGGEKSAWSRRYRSRKSKKGDIERKPRTYSTKGKIPSIKT